MTGWTIDHIRWQMDIPTLDAMFRQWKKVMPLPIAIERVCAWLGIADREPARGTSASSSAKQDSAELLQRYMPVMPASAIPKPMTAQEFRKQHG